MEVVLARFLWFYICYWILLTLDGVSYLYEEDKEDTECRKCISCRQPVFFDIFVNFVLEVLTVDDSNNSRKVRMPQKVDIFINI